MLGSEGLNGKPGTISPLKMSVIPQGTQTINRQKSDVCYSRVQGTNTYLMQGGAVGERTVLGGRDMKMATHSSALALRIPGTGELGRLPSMGSHRVGHD